MNTLQVTYDEFFELVDIENNAFHIHSLGGLVDKGMTVDSCIAWFEALIEPVETGTVFKISSIIHKNKLWNELDPKEHQALGKVIASAVIKGLIKGVKHEPIDHAQCHYLKL